jgi:general secretion pathway protein K
MKAGTRPRGFALLIVLVSLVLLSLMLSGVLATGRSSVRLAENIRDAAEARALSDGAINEALYHALARGAANWPADGDWHSLPGGVQVRIISLAGLINPNIASTDLLAGLMQACGADARQAEMLATAMIDWRSPAVSVAAQAARIADYRRAGLAFAPPGSPFADIAELGDVRGMTPALLLAALPALSLDQPDDPNAALASPLVRRALRLAGLPGSVGGAYSGANPVVAIEARCFRPARVRRRGIFSLAGADSPHPYTVLALADE